MGTIKTLPGVRIITLFWEIGVSFVRSHCFGCTLFSGWEGGGGEERAFQVDDDFDECRKVSGGYKKEQRDRVEKWRGGGSKWI